MFYSRWRSCIKKLLRISYMCHGNLLHWIVNDLPVDMQLYQRFIKFFKGTYNSSNCYVKRCALVATNGSGSAVSNNITVLSNLFHLPRYRLFEAKVVSESNIETEYEEIIAGNVRDMLSLRDSRNSLFTYSELNDMISYTCSS